MNYFYGVSDILYSIIEQSQRQMGKYDACDPSSYGQDTIDNKMIKGNVCGLKLLR